MSNIFFRTKIFLLLFALGIVGCSNIPSSDFYEVDGLISGAITDSLQASGWQPIHYINSKGLVFSPENPPNAGPLTFTIYISNPGNYSFWILTSSGGNTDSLSTLDISMSGPDGFLLSQASADVPAGYRLRWMRAGANSIANMISIEEPGQYTFSIRPRNSVKIQVHKIQLSQDNIDPPFGLGLPSSTSTELSAADLFREIPVMLPPAWVFKPVVGSAGRTDSMNQLSMLFDETGGMWVGADTDDSDWRDNIDVTPGMERSVNVSCDDEIAPVFESGYRFIVTKSSPGIECLERFQQAYRENYGHDRRSVLFHGVKNAYKSESKRFPAPMTPTYSFEWTEDPIVHDGEYVPGGYREWVSDLTNPANSLYGMLFLSMPVDYQSGSTWDSELFIRTVQLTSFLPVMHLILPDNFLDEDGLSDQLTSIEKEQLLDALNLRTSLFPYHYTHAHYTRQTNESVITGFSQYPMQFLYGDAFLVAPVTEPNMDGRIVFFPDGRRWYNYHSGQAYEAGQSWFVETRRDQLPLFVKAGSIIPYQVDENADFLKIEIYTGDAGAFRLVEDDGLSRAYRRAKAARTMFRYNEVEGTLKLTIGAVQAEFEGMTDQRSYDIHFKFVDVPGRVEINGSELKRSSEDSREISWRYDESGGEIIVNLNNVSKHEKLDIVIFP